MSETSKQTKAALLRDVRDRDALLERVADALGLPVGANLAEYAEHVKVLCTARGAALGVREVLRRCHAEADSDERIQYEDTLPADMTQAEYDAWFEQSRVSHGVRVGPVFARGRPSGGVWESLSEQERSCLREALVVADANAREQIELTASPLKRDAWQQDITEYRALRSKLFPAPPGGPRETDQGLPGSEATADATGQSPRREIERDMREWEANEWDLPANERFTR